MNIIIFAFIFFLIVYLIYQNNNSIENITNTKKINGLNTDNNNFLSTTNFNLPNEIVYDNNTSLSYMPNETKCHVNLTPIPKELTYHNHTFNLVGTAVNDLYNQKYFLYESKYDQNGNLLITDNLDYLQDQIYNYLFVTFNNNQSIIHQKFGPRNKIDIGDIIYLLNGINQIGPYLIV